MNSVQDPKVHISVEDDHPDSEEAEDQQIKTEDTNSPPKNQAQSEPSISPSNT